MHGNTPLERFAVSVTRWIGSVPSILIHTILFISAFVAVLVGFIGFEEMMLVLTTIVSLEAIYLSLFIQMSVNLSNRTISEVSADVDDIQKDIDEIQEDVEEISEDVDEIQEDVEEITEEDPEEEVREKEHEKTLTDIQADLRKLLSDIEKLKAEEHIE